MGRTCPSCGTEISTEDAVHCHRCGTKLDTADASWPSSEDPSSDDAGSDWRTAARDGGVGHDEPVIPNPRDPHGPHAGGGPRSQDSTNWAMLAHGSALIAALASVGALVFIGPLAVWLLKREEDPFVERHARQALNFNLLMLVLWVIGFVGAFLTLGIGLIVIIPLGLIIGLGWLITTILATVKAANGEEYDYPFNVTFVK